MNEALHSDFARREAGGQAADSPQLRPVVWSELIARLAAMRDLRQSLSGASTPYGTQPHASPCSAFTDFAEVREGLTHETPGLTT